MQTILRIYFRISSFFAPKLVAKQAFELFQRTFPSHRRFRKKELIFYKEAETFRTFCSGEDLHCYELGNHENELVVLVHGWNSNAGSMHAIANTLVKQGFYVVALDLPAHGHSSLKKTNLLNCSMAFRSFIERLMPDRPFSIVSHSFGSAVASHALSGSRFKIRRWVMLTSPNKVSDIFLEFKNYIALGNTAYNYLVNRAERILNEQLEEVTVANKLKKIDYQNLFILHDEQDKVLPFSNSEAIVISDSKIALIPLQNIGHYRMLFNAVVVNQLVAFFSQEEKTLSFEKESKYVLT